MRKVLMVQRAECYSPNSVENDKAILQAVADRMVRRGYDVCWASEDNPQLTATTPNCHIVLSMGRHAATLRWLANMSRRRNIVVMNSPEGVARSARTLLDTIMEQTGTPKAPADGPDGYWLKRGDAAAQEKDDVQYCHNRDDLQAKIAAMQDRGITQYTVSAHVKGDLVKFYGVCRTGFFRCYYPTDDGQSKFGNEQHNGKARHYSYSMLNMQQEAERLAQAVGIAIYGGDAIVRADGSFCIIDFNDWPSYSRCRDEAAEAIAEAATAMEQEKHQAHDNAAAGTDNIGKNT